MKPNPLPFLHDKYFPPPKPTGPLFTNHTILITGSARVNGIGHHAALTYASLGATHLILTARDPVSTTAIAARDSIADRYPACTVDVWGLDMASYASVREFAARAAAAELQRLDVVVLNAGAAPGVRYTTVTTGSEGEGEGWETILQVNVLSTALLGLLLLPVLRRSEGGMGRLLVVTSEAHRWLEMGDIPLGEGPLRGVNAPPTGEGEQWDPLLQNARSKLFAMYVVEGLVGVARDGDGDGDVMVLAVCPGQCRSDLLGEVRSQGWGSWLGLGVYDAVFSKSAEIGGWVYVKASGMGREVSGKWVRGNGEVAEPGLLVTNEEGRKLGREVWKEIVGELKRVVPEVARVVGGT